jgi:hypothetical protein
MRWPLTHRAPAGLARESGKLICDLVVPAPSFCLNLQRHPIRVGTYSVALTGRAISRRPKVNARVPDCGALIRALCIGPSVVCPISDPMRWRPDADPRIAPRRRATGTKVRRINHNRGSCQKPNTASCRRRALCMQAQARYAHRPRRIRGSTYCVGGPMNEYLRHAD